MDLFSREIIGPSTWPTALRELVRGALLITDDIDGVREFECSADAETDCSDGVECDECVANALELPLDAHANSREPGSNMPLTGESRCATRPSSG